MAGVAIAIGIAGGGDAASAQSRSQGTQSRAAPGGGETIRYASPEAAYNHGLSSLKAGHPEMALRSFEYAARHGIFFAQFYLGRLYADNSIPYTDHGKAFDIFRQIVLVRAERRQACTLPRRGSRFSMSVVSARSPSMSPSTTGSQPGGR